MTSLTKVCVAVSLTDASALAVSACCSMDIDLVRFPFGPRRGEIQSIRLIKWEESRRMQSRFFRPGNRLDPRWVAGSFEELDEPVAGNGRGAGIHQRVKVERLIRHHGGIKHNRDALRRVVDDGKWR